MARLAATEFGADWVLNADADEFWWPRGGSLKEVLTTVPERYGVIRGCWRHFLPRADDGGFFAERMTVRLGRPAFPGAKETIFHAHQKVAHRADPEVTIEAETTTRSAPTWRRYVPGTRSRCSTSRSAPSASSSARATAAGSETPDTSRLCTSCSSTRRFARVAWTSSTRPSS